MNVVLEPLDNYLFVGCVRTMSELEHLLMEGGRTLRRFRKLKKHTGLRMLRMFRLKGPLLHSYKQRTIALVG